MKTIENQKTNDTSLIITMLISIGIVCVAALLVIGYLAQDDSQSNFFLKKNNKSETIPKVEQQIKEQGQLQKFESYSELTEYIEKNNSNGYIGFNGGIKTFAVEDMALESAVPMNTSRDVATGLGGGGGDYSSTNIQVAGVDEADIIKTDGDYIYAISRNTVFIIDATPAEETKIVSEIKLENHPINIYINDNSLIVFGNDYSLFDNKQIASIIPRSQYTFLTIYDIEDKNSPQEIKKLNFEGSYSNSRMIGDYLYFITSYWPGVYTDMPIPRLLDDGKLVCNSDTPDGVKCPYVNYFGIPYPSQQMTTVSAINTKNINEDVAREIYMLENSRNIYASEKALYLTTTKYLNEFQLNTEVLRVIVEPKLSDKLKAKIQKIEQADSDLLSENEKIQKISSVLQTYIMGLSIEEQKNIQEQTENLLKQKYTELKDELEKTIIHKITLNKNEIKQTASGEVPGTVLNQFSMDENNDFFRIATTNNQRWFPWTNEEEQQSYNNLYILDSNLKITGNITNIAPDERIYSVRFMQDRAYMVTFEQVDPLFVIDVADPYNPSILGELKIPGFSNYLHPYDANTIIGIGQDTTIDEFDRVRTEGVKLSLFDVSDVSNPQEIDSYVVSERSSTPVQHDHKAFLFSKEKNLLVLPINTWDSKLNFNGVLAFNITLDGFDRIGAIEHTDINPNTNHYQNQIQRSLYISDSLYTLSTAELKVNDIETLDDITFVQLGEDEIRKDYPEPIPLLEAVKSIDIDNDVEIEIMEMAEDLME